MSFNIGTLVYYAREFSSSQQVNQILKSSKKNNHCTLVLEKCFNKGEDYISDGARLYQFKDGYYKKIDEGEIRRKIADFFDKSANFLTPKYVNESYQWLIDKTYISPQKYNRTGLNLNNGFLEVKYSNNKPLFNFTPPTRDSYHTYKSFVDYDPNISSQIAEKYIFEMFGNQQYVDVFLKNLASIFDRNILRIKYGRQLRALILYGPGSNGKDTLKEWIYLLLGTQGITSIPLHDFKLADKKSSLLAPLLTSRVNWASENNKIALDRCACLKTIVTGDSILIDVKYQNSVTLNVDIPLIFNFNEEPAVSILNQASLSRFCILKLPYIFCINPNSSKNEKPADFKLKNDKEYLQKTILPSFLNLLIEKFISFYEHGVDYTELDLELRQIAENSNHLYDFIDEWKIKECSLEYGMTPTELFNEYYKPYLIENGFATDTSYDLIFHDCEFDRFAKNPNQLSKMFSKIFYGLKRKKINSKRRIGLNIASKLPP